MEIIQNLLGIKSTLIASQLPLSAWFDIIGEPTLSGAILDRLTAGSHRLEFKGELMRKTNDLTIKK